MRPSSLGLFALALLAPSTALAQDRATSSRPSTSASTSMMLSLETGGFGASQNGSNVFLGGAALMDVGALRLGLRGEASTHVIDEHTVAGGFLIGAGTQQGRWRLDALGQVGLRHTWDIARGTFLGISFGGDTKITLPTAGGRLGVSYVIAGQPGRGAVIGLWGFVDRDLATKSVERTNDVIFGTTQSTERFGGTRYGALLSVGVTFDLAPSPPSQVASR